MSVNHYYHYKVIVITEELGLQWIDPVRVENNESDFAYNTKI